VRAAQKTFGTNTAAEAIETLFSRLAGELKARGVKRLVVAGGETSGAVTKALEVERLDIGAEIAPGVPWTYCESGRHEIALTLKSGNFGAETFFSDALAAL
jgi:uncharacterized protein YgbK (DUF1537 family)